MIIPQNEYFFFGFVVFVKADECSCSRVFPAHPQRVRVRQRFSGDARRPLGFPHGDHDHLLQQVGRRRHPGGIQRGRGPLAPTDVTGQDAIISASVHVSGGACVFTCRSALSRSCS